MEGPTNSFAAGSSGAAAAAALAAEEEELQRQRHLYLQQQQQQHEDAATTTPVRPPRSAAAPSPHPPPPQPPNAAADALPADDPVDGSWQPKRHPPFVIGVAGGTASGKTTVCDRIVQRLGDRSVALVSQDAFYRPLTDSEREIARQNSYNFDHPDAFDTPLLLECLKTLGEGRPFDCPIYDFATHSRAEETRRIDPADVVVIEGILVLAVPAVRDACSLRVYVDTDDDVRLARRIQRDVAVRGRDVAGVIAQYQRFVKPCFDTFVGPSRRFADVIVPWHDGDACGGGGFGFGFGAYEEGEEDGFGSASAGPSAGEAAAAAAGAGTAGTGGGGAAREEEEEARRRRRGATATWRTRSSASSLAGDRGGGGGSNQGDNGGGGNVVAIDLIEQHIRSKLQQHPLRRLFPMLSIIHPTFQLVGMLTLLRDAATPKDKFVFFADRVIRLVVEAGLGHLPFAEKTVRTPTGHRYVGVEFCRGICGVSVIRSGEAMETALRACCHGVKIGKLLVARTRWHCGAGAMNGGGRNGCGGGSAAGGFVRRIDELASPSPAPSPAPAAAAAGAGGGRPPRPPTGAAGAAPGANNTRSMSCDGDAGSPPPHGMVRLHSANGPPPPPLGGGGPGGGNNAGSGSSSGSGNNGSGGNGSLVIYEKLPRDIAQRHVLLMDPVLTTGHTATKAVETLLARGVLEERIIFLSILASPAGVARLCGAHPRLRLVTAEIDEGVDERWQLVPGMGEFGQRYYS